MYVRETVLRNLIIGLTNNLIYYRISVEKHYYGSKSSILLFYLSLELIGNHTGRIIVWSRLGQTLATFFIMLTRSSLVAGLICCPWLVG